MQPRRRNAEAQINGQAREVIGPFVKEVGRLNDEAARLIASHNRPNLTEADGAAILRKAAEARAALLRVERQFEGALRSAPTDVAQHGRVQDLRAAIAAVRTRLAALGASETETSK